MRRFMAVIAAVFILLALAGCDKAEVEGIATANPAVTVDRMFEFQGTTVYRFMDQGYHRYFAVCNGVEPERREQRSGGFYWTASSEGSSIRIQNNSNQFIQVYDGAWLLSSLVPGEERITDLKGFGERRLKVRSPNWTVETGLERFEQNCGWTLTVEMDAVHLDLRPTACK